MKSWIQTWANYYSHITRNMPADETHSVLSDERERHMRMVAFSKEHLEGIDLFYSQSHLANPHPPGEKERADKSRSNDDATVHTRELSDREILL